MSAARRERRKRNRHLMHLVQAASYLVLRKLFEQQPKGDFRDWLSEQLSECLGESPATRHPAVIPSLDGVERPAAGHPDGAERSGLNAGAETSRPAVPVYALLDRVYAYLGLLTVEHQLHPSGNWYSPEQLSVIAREMLRRYPGIEVDKCGTERLLCFLRAFCLLESTNLPSSGSVEEHS